MWAAGVLTIRSATCAVFLCTLAGVDSLIVAPHFSAAFVHGSNELLPISDVFACQDKTRRRALLRRNLVSMRSFPGSEHGIRLLFPSMAAGQGIYRYLMNVARDCQAILARTAVEWASDTLTLLAAGMVAVLLGAIVMM